MSHLNFTNDWRDPERLDETAQADLDALGPFPDAEDIQDLIDGIPDCLDTPECLLDALADAQAREDRDTLCDTLLRVLSDDSTPEQCDAAIKRWKDETGDADVPLLLMGKRLDAMVRAGETANQAHWAALVE